MTAVNPAAPAASQQAVVEAALVLLERMGLSPADLTAVPRAAPPVPTFAEYVPVVSAAVSAGTRRAYGSYWNRIVEHWGGRRLDEPTPSEIRQLMAYVKTHVVARRNARGGRSAQEHLVAALRCLYRRAVEDGLITEADNPAAEGGQAAPPAVHPPGRAGHPAGGDQPGRRDHRRRPGTGHAAAAAAHRDRLPPRRRAGAAPGRPGPGPVPDPAAGEGRDGPLAAGLPHPDGPPGRARPGAARPGRTGSCCATPTGGRSPTAAMTTCGPASAGTCPGCATQQISTHWIRHTTLTWVERNFGYAVARAYAGHTDGGGEAGATATYVRASLSEVATALAALTGEPHPARHDGRVVTAMAALTVATDRAARRRMPGRRGPVPARSAGPAAADRSGAAARAGPDHAVLAAAGPGRPGRGRGVVRLGRHRAEDRVRAGLPAAGHLALAAPGHRHHPAGRRRGVRGVRAARLAGPRPGDQRPDPPVRQVVGDLLASRSAWPGRSPTTCWPRPG